MLLSRWSTLKGLRTMAKTPRSSAWYPRFALMTMTGQREDRRHRGRAQRQLRLTAHAEARVVEDQQRESDLLHASRRHRPPGRDHDVVALRPQEILQRRARVGVVAEQQDRLHRFLP